MARYWYAYISPGSIFDPASYRLLSITPPCTTGNTICVLYARAGDLNPVFGTNLQQYITNSTVSNTAQPPFGKKYLYKISH